MVRLRVLLGMVIGVDEGLPVQDVHVQVVGVLGEVAGEDAHQVVNALGLRLAQGLEG